MSRGGKSGLVKEAILYVLRRVGNRFLEKEIQESQ